MTNFKAAHLRPFFISRRHWLSFALHYRLCLAIAIWLGECGASIWSCSWHFRYWTYWWLFEVVWSHWLERARELSMRRKLGICSSFNNFESIIIILYNLQRALGLHEALGVRACLSAIPWLLNAFLEDILLKWFQLRRLLFSIHFQQLFFMAWLMHLTERGFVRVESLLVVRQVRIMLPLRNTGQFGITLHRLLFESIIIGLHHIIIQWRIQMVLLFRNWNRSRTVWHFLVYIRLLSMWLLLRGHARVPLWGIVSEFV